MDSRWLDLFREQKAAGFPDLAGTRLSLRLPISDALVSRIIADYLPPSSKLRHLEVRAEASNRVKVVVQLAKPSFLPALSIALDIEQQPVLPSSPVLVLRVASSPAVMAFAGSALRFLDSMPPGVAMDGSRIALDLRLLAGRYNVSDLFDHLEAVTLTTEEGRLVLSAQAVLPAPEMA
jgi:hypothetical protein